MTCFLVSESLLGHCVMLLELLLQMLLGWTDSWVQGSISGPQTQAFTKTS